MKQFGDIYRGKTVIITGHTGFKGSWLSMWLSQLGAEITGISLSPESTPNHWGILGLNVDDRRLDIRDYPNLQLIFNEVKPDIVFHLAAQPLVRRSYRDPLETWSTNVMGTANVIEACRQVQSVKAIVAVTTDKCYENNEWHWGYRENDRLGGHDPYSASKAASELVAASYREAFFHNAHSPLIATARAGNVIGGGDWSEDRLIPDLIRSVTSNQSLEIRSPNATRPWQHVLESLCGYLLLGQNLLLGMRQHAEPWNFGPALSGNRSVVEVLNMLIKQWPDLRWHTTASPQPHEANLLFLDSTKARNLLNWQPIWGLEDTLGKTADWYRAWLQSGQVISDQQLSEFISAAEASSASWIQA